MIKYSDDIKTRLTARHQKCLELVGVVKGKKILNIGSYNGWFEEKVSHKGAKEVFGIDINQQFIDMTRKNASPARFFKMDILNLNFPKNYFDIVTIFDVLEHLAKNKEEKVFKKINNVLKKGGELIVSVPNNYFLFNLLDPAWYFGHRHYSLETIKKLIERSGSPFEIKEYTYGGGFFEYLTMVILYFFKFFGYEYPLKEKLEKLRLSEYYGKTKYKFVTLFIKIIKIK